MSTARRSKHVSFPLFALLAAVCLAGLLGGTGRPSSAGTPSGPPANAAVASDETSTPYPPVGTGTHFLDHTALLDDAVDPQWYESNVPFVDLPDEQIEDTYYYRWQTFKEALKYTGPDDGWIVSEFLGPVGYSAPKGGISAAAAHHIYEGRWLRDTRYLDDYVDYWLSGSGSGAKPATDGLNENTTDWSHQYSFWVADAMVARARVNGRWDFATDRITPLERQWKGWAPQFDKDLGLYWQTPVWDAMEFTASSYQSDDPYHGGDGFRPTLNAYQYGDAHAIASLLEHRGEPGDRAAASHWTKTARGLSRAQERSSWDEKAQFYKHVMRDENPEHLKIKDREEIGFIPWYFHMAPSRNAAAWAQLVDPQGFAAPYGPTTVERRSPWFMHEASNGCCRWDGPSWPYATSQTLTAMANVLQDYPAQPYVDAGDYYDILRGYALAQRKGGRPYVAEAHDPDQDRWIYDGRGHSEDYNHSTFNDLVLSGLLGIRPQDRGVRIAPLVPKSWDTFAAENVPYQGHNLSMLWDRDGTKYDAGRGLSVYLDGRMVHRQADLSPVQVRIPAADPRPLPQEVDDLANVEATGYPTASASYSWRGDTPADAIDGQDFALDVPSTRWTTYSSPRREDWLDVDLGVPTRISDVRISFYDDGGGVRTPTSFALQRMDNAGVWVDVPGQQRFPSVPVRGRPSRVSIQPAITADRLRVRPVRSDGGAVGITAVQAWRPEDPRVSAEITSPDRLSVSAGRPFRVDATVRTTERASVRPSVLVPRGWAVRPLQPVGNQMVDPGHSWTTHWEVTPPTGLPLGTSTPLRLLADSVLPSGEARSTGDLTPVQTAFDPADFPTTLWDDDFSSDTTASYHLVDAFGEPVPDLAVSDGRLVASAAQPRSGALLRAPVDGQANMAVVLEPATFSGGEPEDSVFFGRSAGRADLVSGWYNHHVDTTGVDVRVGGRNLGDDATGGCCTTVGWRPGDRLAAVFQDGALTTWVEQDGGWRLLRRAPFGGAVDAGSVASWSPAFGMRLTGGTIALDRVTVLGDQ